MSFYEIKQGQNPTLRDNQLNLRQAGQQEGTETGYVMLTNTSDETLNGAPSRVLNNIQTDLSQVTEPVEPDAQTKWTGAGIERELYQSIDDGRSQLAIPITGPKADELQRSPQTQAYYEQDVVGEAQRVAHRNGADFEVQDVDGTQYAVVKPNAESAPGKVDPIKGSFVAYQAMQAGMPTEEVTANLKRYGYDEQDLAEIMKRVDVITRAQEAGMSVDEISQRMYNSQVTADQTTSQPKKYAGTLQGMAEAMKDQGVTDPVRAAQLARSQNISYWSGMPQAKPTPKTDKYQQVMDKTNSMTAEELVSSLKVLHPTMVSDSVTTIPAYFGNKEAQQRYDQARDASRQRIIDLAKEDYNLDLVWQPNGVASEGWYAQTENGLVEVTPGFWEDFRKVSGEVTGGIAGAILGGKRGAKTGVAFAAIAGQAGPQAAAPEEIITVPVASAIGGIIGAAVGGWTGAVAGSQFDYMYEAMKLQEDMEAEAMAYRGLNAFEAAAIGEVLGYPVVKGLGKGWNGIIAAKNHIMGGEAKAAYQSLKDTTFLDDSQIEAIVTQLEKHAVLQGNKYEKGIQAVALTQPGMQDLVRAAGGTHPRASSATAHVVTSRAEQVLAQTAQLTDDQVPRMLAQDLQNYVGDVKDAYGRVKAQATQSPGGLNFEWDFKELAIQPVMDTLEKKITDPVTKEKFLLQMRRINAMSESRTYGDLIELRQLVNDFLYNKRITKADDKATLRGVLANIDGAIEDGAQHVVENPKQWLEDWATVRKDYSTMKQVERTALYRAIFNKDGSMRPVQPETVVKAMGKYITALDGSFEEVMTKLPVEGRKMYEGAVIDALAQRYTAGVEKGAKAIHFPLLADELRKINFTTPDARATKKALIELGETFKNDVWLAQTSGQITIPKFQSYLTADPVVRAKFEIASGMFNYIKSKAPGDSNRQLALVRMTSRLLEKPLDAKNFKQLQQEVFDDANLSKQILELQQEAARNRAREVEVGTPKVKIYEGGKLKGTGPSTSIPMHRIVTLEQAREIAEAEALTLDSKSLDAVLKQYGYEAILQGSDRVRLLGDK